MAHILQKIIVQQNFKLPTPKVPVPAFPKHQLKWKIGIRHYEKIEKMATILQKTII